MVPSLRTTHEVRMRRPGAVECFGNQLAQLSCYMLGTVPEVDHLLRKLCEGPRRAGVAVVIGHRRVPAGEAICQSGVTDASQRAAGAHPLEFVVPGLCRHPDFEADHRGV